MRILQVTQSFSPAHGGAVEVPYQLSKELAKRGHEVTIYTSNHDLSWEYVNSAPEVRVRPFKTWLSWLNFFVTPGMIARVKKEIRDFDVVHMHGYYSFQNIIVHHYAKKHNIPYVLQAHGTVGTYFERGSLKKTFDAIRGSALLKDAAKLIAVTATEAEQYETMGIGEDKIEIVPNGVNLAEFENLPQRGQFREKYGLDDARKVVLYLGRIHKIKGPDLLAKAFAGLSKALGDAKLVIVGPDDGYLAALKQLMRELKIEERVFFTGPLYGGEKLQAYVDADVYILPSSYEIFGITALEACACGTPVIVTDRCGIAAIVADQLGFVVPFKKDKLSDAILRMLADDKLRREFGEKGRLLVRDKFNWEKIAEQVESVYLSCLASRS